eukprot:c17343_g1_i1 orf=318-2318(+)
MARTYAAFEIDKEAQSRGWRLLLCTFEEVKLYRKLRKGGFFGGFGSIAELKARCLQLATLPIAVDASENEKLVENLKDSLSELLSCAVTATENQNCKKELADGKFTSDQFLCKNREECFVGPTATMDQVCYAEHMKQTAELEVTYSNLERGVLKTSATVPVAEANSSMSFLIPPIQCSSQQNVGIYHGISSLDFQHPVKDPKLTIATEALSGDDNIVSLLIGERSDSNLRLPSSGKGRFDGNSNAKLGQLYNDESNRMQISCKVKSGEQGRKELEARGSDSGESDGDSDNKPIYFKRTRRQTVVELRSAACLPDADNTAVHALLKRTQISATDQSNNGNWDGFDVGIDRSATSKHISSLPESDVDSDSEPLILKRAVKLCKRKHESGDIANRDLICLPASECNDVDIEHEMLGTSTCKLIAQKEILRAEETEMHLERVLHAAKQDSADMLNSCPCHGAGMILDSGEDSMRDCGVGHTQQKCLLDHKVPQISCVFRDTHFCVVPEFTTAKDFDVQAPETCSSSLGICDSGEEDIKCMVRNLIMTSQQHVQAQHGLSERNSLTSAPIPAISRLGSIIEAARKALRVLDGGGSCMEAEHICPKQLLREFEENMAELKAYDVDQYFPPVIKQMEVAEKVNCYVQDGDTLVVVSGWRIDFFTHLKERLSRS